MMELVKEMTAEDRATLLRSVSIDPWVSTIDQIQKDSDANKMLIYRLRADGLSGIMVMSVYTRGLVKTLFMEHLAGTGFIRYRRDILECVRKLAKAMDCSSITGSSLRASHCRFYSEMGFKVESVTFQIGVEDGWK